MILTFYFVIGVSGVFTPIVSSVMGRIFLGIQSTGFVGFA